MLENFCVNYTLYEMHVLRISLAKEMSDFWHFAPFFFGIRHTSNMSACYNSDADDVITLYTYCCCDVDDVRV